MRRMRQMRRRRMPRLRRPRMRRRMQNRRRLPRVRRRMQRMQRMRIPWLWLRRRWRLRRGLVSVLGWVQALVLSLASAS